jgi:hypothetical protein
MSIINQLPVRDRVILLMNTYELFQPSQFVIAWCRTFTAPDVRNRRETVYHSQFSETEYDVSWSGSHEWDNALEIAVSLIDDDGDRGKFQSRYESMCNLIESLPDSHQLFMDSIGEPHHSPEVISIINESVYA